MGVGGRTRSRNLLGFGSEQNPKMKSLGDDVRHDVRFPSSFGSTAFQAAHACAISTLRIPCSRFVPDLLRTKQKEVVLFSPSSVKTGGRQFGHVVQWRVTRWPVGR